MQEGTVLRNVALWLRPAGWPFLPDAARRRTLLLAWAAILAQVVFVGGWVLAGALEPRYSPVRQYISELGRDGAANPWIFVTFVGDLGIGLDRARDRGRAIAAYTAVAAGDAVVVLTGRRVRDSRRAAADGLLDRS